MLQGATEPDQLLDGLDTGLDLEYDYSDYDDIPPVAGDGVRLLMRMVPWLTYTYPLISFFQQVRLLSPTLTLKRETLTRCAVPSLPLRHACAWTIGLSCAAVHQQRLSSMLSYTLHGLPRTLHGQAQLI